MRTPWVLIFSLLLSTSIVFADVGPPLAPRMGVGMAYDLVNNRVVMYGGYLAGTQFVYLNGTWSYSFKDNLWTKIIVATDPGPLGAAAMAYSPDHKMILLFGGMNTRGRVSDTWVFDCTSDKWIKIEPSSRPEGRSDSAMIYDTVNKRFILYGGWGSQSGLIQDLWIYDPDLKNWSEVKTETSPGRMYGHSMVWDPTHMRAILYGGHLNSPLSRLYVENPWFYYPKNGTWVEQVYDSRPHGRYWGAMGYDYEGGKLVYYGGGWNEGPSNETWILDLKYNKWSMLETEISPSNRLITRIVSIPDKGFLLFGGTGYQGRVHFNDTWVLNTSNEWVELHPSTVIKNPVASTSTQGIPGFPLVSLFIGLFFFIILRKKSYKSH